MVWAFILLYVLLAAATSWWFGRQIHAIDQKIETINK